MASDYEILGVEPTATAKEVREAYVFLVTKFHPDANPGREEKAADHFRKIDDAYRRIKEGKPRRTTGRRTPAPRHTPSPARRTPPPAAAPPPKPEINVSMNQLIVNALALPFASAEVLTREQYKAKIKAALFPPELVTKHGKQTWWLQKLSATYDKAPLAKKIEILTRALNDPARYLRWLLQTHP